jgi:hypothetical protein
MGPIGHAFGFGFGSAIDARTYILQGFSEGTGVPKAEADGEA